MTLKDRIETFKRYVITETIKEAGGNKRAAADRLGCHRNTVLRYSDKNTRQKRVRSQSQIATDQLSAFKTT